MKNKNKPKNIEDVLRETIVNSKMSRYQISRLSGVADSQLCFFVNGQRSLTLKSAAKVAEVLELELIRKEN